MKAVAVLAGVLLVLLLVLVACTSPTGTPVQVEVVNADEIGFGGLGSRAVGDTNVTNLVASGDLTAGDDVTAGDDLIVTDDTTISGNLALSGLMAPAAGTSITVTNGSAFTPTASIQPIVAAGAVTPTITIPAAGRLVCLYNTGSNAILIQDTGNQVLTGDWTAGQYDWLCGWSDGTRFMEVSRANN